MVFEEPPTDLKLYLSSFFSYIKTYDDPGILIKKSLRNDSNSSPEENSMSSSLTV